MHNLTIDKQQINPKWHHYINQHLGLGATYYFMPPDCSTKQFIRIKHGDKKMILMDVSDDSETYHNFFQINKLFKRYNLGVPKIYFHDDTQKLMIMEDFGVDSFTAYLKNNAQDEERLYLLAIQALKQMQEIDYDHINLPLYNEKLTQGIDVFKEWFLEKWCKLSISYMEMDKKFGQLFAQLNSVKLVVTMRDYHADNLFYMAKKHSIEQLGIIDFQDAAISSLTYDLVSLLEDARRDINPETVNKAYDFFLSDHKTSDHADIKLTYQILGMQRNLRIIGVFIRKMLRDDKIQYKHYIPRVYKYLANNPLMHEREFYPLLNIINNQLAPICSYGEK